LPIGNDRYAIYFLHREQNYVALINLNGDAGKIKLHAKMEVELEGYESIVLKDPLT